MVSWHEADSLRMLPSGPDLVQIAHSMRSPVKDRILTPGSFFFKLFRQRVDVVKIGLRKKFREDFYCIFPVLGKG